MRATFLTLIVLYAAQSCSDHKKDSNVDWLLNNAYEIRSIDPTDSDYMDLQPLKSAIGEARMVLLGEQEHGDGSAYLAKSRLVKFLHDEMGFNVLAFEADFFGVHKAWTDYKAGEKEYQDVLNQMYIFWPQSKMCQDLFQTVEQSQQSNFPLKLAGFDCQQITSVSKEELIPALDSIVNHYDISLIRSEKEFFNKTLEEAMYKFHDQQISDESQSDLLRILSVLSLEFKKKEIDPFWIQELDNIEGFLMHTWHWWIDRENDMVDNNHRDIQMAKNILWLLNEKYKDEKIIIWAANSHIAKTDTLYEVESQGWKPDIRQFPMGEVLFDSLQEAMYSIGFTSFEGQSSHLKYDPKNMEYVFVAKPFEPADSSSLEHEFHNANWQYAFVDLKGNATDPWLRIDRRMRMWRPQYIKVKLPDIYDGIFYIDEMQPNKRIE